MSFLVRVSCMTFNHAPYIEDAMNGFCMQETTFPFVCTILDDASTDGEPEVIKKYLLEHFDLDNKNVVRNEETNDYVMTFAQHKTNKNCYFAVYFLKYNHYGKKSKTSYIKEWQEQVKYVAVCEGDDYWIDKGKLHKQCDILEKNPQVTMVYTNFETVDENGRKIVRTQYERYKQLSKTGDILPTLINTNFPMTLTVMVRKNVYESHIYKGAPVYLDYMLFVAAAFVGDAWYINVEMASYRNSPNSMMNTQKKQINEVYRMLYPYIFLEYACGHVKKSSFMNDALIKNRILKKVLSIQPYSKRKKLLYELLKINKTFIPFLFTAFIQKLINKVIKW